MFSLATDVIVNLKIRVLTAVTANITVKQLVVSLSAPVTKVSNSPLMEIIAKTLTNAPRIMVAALQSVRILRVHSCALVRLVLS